MSNIYKGEMQDYQGNTIYPHTEADVVFCSDGETVQEKLVKQETALGSVTGKTDSLEVNDSNILATSMAVHKLKTELGGLKFGIDEDGNYGYYKDGADTVTPFKSQEIIYLGTAKSYNISNIVGVENIDKYTIDDFIVGISGLPGILNNYWTADLEKGATNLSSVQLSKAYKNGILTISGGSVTAKTMNTGSGATVGSITGNCTTFAYLIKK